MAPQDPRTAILAPTYPGQPSSKRLHDLAQAGHRPRKDYVELARTLNAQVIDLPYLADNAVPTARLLARRDWHEAAQLWHAYRQRNHYDHVFVWSEKIGLPLAFLYKLSRCHCDFVLLSIFLSRPQKAFFLRRLKVHSHLRAIVQFSSTQMGIAATKLGIPEHKLHHVHHPVDETFWRPQGHPRSNLICSVGWEARDYETLTRATSDMDVEVHVAVGVSGLSSSAAQQEDSPPLDRQDKVQQPPSSFRLSIGRNYTSPYFEKWLRELSRSGAPRNLQIRYQLSPQRLRSLYGHASFVVLPLHDVDFDAGVTSLTEAMAMGKAVIVTRTRGQVDVVRHGEQGLYVPPRDPRSLRQAIEYLLQRPEEAQRMGRAGRALVERHHKLDDFAARLVRIAQHAPSSLSRSRRIGRFKSRRATRVFPGDYP